ncbi:serine/threonine-protein kinase [Nannocystaceae bacterium ST9]
MRAYDPNLQRHVAIKCLPSDRPPVGALDELASEARALAALDVPQVAKVFDCSHAELSVGDRPVRCVLIVMEYVQGVSLRRWMRTGRTRTEQIEVLVAAAKGLEAAHSANIVHRDFKPENVVVPESLAARVVDFGLAYRMALGRITGSALQRSDGIPGTPEYMAPEVRAGRVTDRSDQFSFAVAAWEVLTGKRPQVGALTGAEQLPRSLAEQLARALSERPENRFDSLAVLRAALERCDESFLRQHAPWVAGVAALGATAVAFALGHRAGRRSSKRGPKP